MTTTTGSLREDQYTCMILFRSVPFIMRNVSDNACGEKQSTVNLNKSFFSKIVPFMR